MSFASLKRTKVRKFSTVENFLGGVLKDAIIKEED